MKKRVDDIRDFFCSINLKIFAVLVLLLTFVSCEFEDSYSPYTSKATLSVSVLTYQATTIVGNTRGNPDYSWEVVVLKGNLFCTPQPATSLLGKDFKLSFSANESEEPRMAEIRITFSDGYTNTFTVTQLPKSEHPEYDRPWGEQPRMKEDEGLIYKSYYTTLSGNKRVRNFSVCYDPETLVSRWVAYPLHDIYTSGSVGRTEMWSYDDAYYVPHPQSGVYIRQYVSTSPVIPQSLQQNLGAGGYQNGRDDRGHMLPSASRQSSYELNAQTYYATNMMPQHSEFNQGNWATLKGCVRNWRCSDTLFVVTGTLFEKGAYPFQSHNMVITRPSHAYKLVLRTKSGRSGKHIVNITSAEALKCIGFLFTNDMEGAETSIRDAAVSVAEIEKRTGFVFFRNLNPAIADEVKAQKNLRDWGL